MFNWVQDLDIELWNAGIDDPQFLTTRISFCEEMLKRFGDDGEDLRNQNTRRALAESYASLGHADTVDALYTHWLNNDSSWGWGWIGWSDCYDFALKDNKNLEKSEQILRQGLSVQNVCDRNDILARLADLLGSSERNDEADELRRQIERKPTFAWTSNALPPSGAALDNHSAVDKKAITSSTST